MGMTWSEYKAYREKKKKEEEQTKKQQKTSSNKAEKTITNNANNQEKNNNLINTISQNNRLPLNNENANKIASNTPSLQDIVSKNNSSKIVQTNNNPLAKQIEEQNANKPLQKAIEEQKKKPKTTQKEPSTWERIMDNFRIGGYGGITGVAQTGYRDIRDIDNMYTDASSSLRHQVLSTFFGEHGENFARNIDDKIYKWNNDRNQVYNYALDVLNKEQQTNKQNIQQNIEAVKQSGDKVGTKFAELAPSVGNNAMGLLAGTVNPALAFTYYKGSSEASYYDDALQRGMTEDQAKVYSKLMSYVEAGTETISAGNILKGGKAIKAVASGAKNIGVKEGLKAGFNVFKESAKEETANTLKQGLKNYGIGIAEEFFQEAITEPIQEFTAMKVAGEDKADWNNMWQRMLQSGVDGALSSAILAGANMGISSCQGIVTKVQNGQEFTTEEYKTAIKDASEKVDVGKMTTDGIKNQVEKLKTEMQQSQKEVNKDINPKNKMPQNQFSQAEKTETLRQEARNKLESIKQNYDENSYNQMQEFIETAPSEKALNQVISDLNKEAETKQVAPLKQKQEVQLPLKQQETQNKSFEDVVFDAMNNYESNEVESPLKNRDMDSIGKQTKVNAYQYDNPQVKPYFQEMAQQMGEDLAYISSSDNRSTQKGGGTKLSATTKAMDILHNEQGYSYNQIAQGLQNIIDDKGSENNAISKKIELVIDEQLRNGYNNAFGKYVEPNQEYINTIQGNKDVQLPMKQKQEISLPLNEDVLNNQNTSQEQYSLVETQPQNNFKYEQTDNEKVNKLYESTSKYFDDSQKTHNMLKPMEKIIRDKGYNITFDDTLDDNVNGRIRTNQETGETEITINPNSNRKGEFIIGHELTHAIETQEMVDLVKKRMEKDGELRNAVEDLKKLYGTDDINGEVLADISGQLFGNQEFINNLSIEKPSVFKRIYDKIISLANKITGNSNEALFIKDLKNKWEKAYRENTNNIKEAQYSETNIIKDNQGRQLSNQQQEYFKDSKVRDENGNLKVYYHGTEANRGIPKEYWFSVFDEDRQGNHGGWYGNGFYFTENEEHAQNYAGTKGNIYEAYLNIKNPYIPYQNGDSMISFQDDFKNNFEEAKKIDGKLTGEQITKILKNNGYDGIIIGDDAIAFYSNQIKNVDNKTPTTNPDIRYSLSEDGAMKDNKTGKKVTLQAESMNDGKNLLAIHNLDESKLKGVLELGGFPVPSIAITNPDIVNHSQFGDISVIFNKDTINPETDTRNEVYDRDVWSPTFPQIEYDVNVKALNKVRNIVGGYGNEYLREANSKLNNIDSLIGNKGYEKLKDELKDNKAFKYVYYKAINPDFKIFTKMDSNDVSTRYSNQFLKEFIDEYGKEIPSWVSIDSETRKEIVDKFKKKWIPILEEKRDRIITEEKAKAEPRKFIIGIAESTVENNLEWLDSLGGQDKLIENLNEIQRTGGTKEVKDYSKTNEFIDKNINQKDYEQWLDDNFKNIVGKKGIYNGKEYLTSKGNRRTFNQLHEDYNLSNLVKELTKQSTVAGESGFGAGQNFGTLQAKMSNKFNSIQDIKNAENRIQYDNDIKKLLDKYSSDIYEYMNELREYSYNKNQDYYYGDNAGYALNDFADYKVQNVDNLKKALEKNGINSKEVPSKLLNDVVNEINELKNIPTDYFEAKPQRAVGFDEIDAIVIPKDVSKEVKQQLKDRGIKTIEYDRNNENERADILKSLNEYKFSKTSKSWQEYLEKNYRSEGTTTDLRDIRLPMKEKQEVKLPMKGNVQQNQNNNTSGENINWNEIERPENNQKFRKHYRSIIESSNTTAEAKAVAKELMGRDTYVPETNKGQLAQADQRIMTSSPEVELQSLLSRAMNGEKISSVDIAVGERLIQYFSKTGNKQQLQDAIQATAMAGTSAGQTVQALSMLNHQTPQGQATWIQRSVDKMNKELAKKKGGTITTDADGNLQVINKQGVDITNKVDLFNLTPEMIDKIMNSENQEQMYKNIDEVYEELGQQVPKGMLEKIDSWRYFSMLANARTHIRNMVGNLAMGKTQRIKDKLAGGIEDVVSKFNPKMERTKTLAFADKKTKDFAKQDFKNMEVQSRLELNENKYNPQSRLQNARRTFKSDAMENTLGRLFNLNDKLLEAEDGIGLKAGYQKALADYITANKIDVDNITDAQLNKARNYAVQQAKEATFHQANAIASAVTQFQNKNNVTKFFTDALLPFKKTPMNVAKAGMEYSPLQIAKSATIDVVNLRKGNISINQYIDNLSKGMTGTGIALAGYALAKAGILKASGGDDKDKEKYDEEQGKQSYSIQIAGKTYSLDWLAPTGIPLFIGAETHKLFNQEENEKGTEKRSEEDRLNQAIKGASNLLNAGATAINPMSEMSMISGLTSALSSYNTSDNLGSLGNMMTNMGKSYVNQFFPTLMGQVAKTGDEYERTTKSTAKGTIGKAVDQTINQIKNKVPGLRQTLPIKTDIWGKEVKQEVNLPLRAVNNFINPATVKEVSTDKVDMELNKLYEENRNSALLPDILTKTVQLNKQTYRLSNKEYAEFTKNYGQTSHKLIENFIKTSDYNKLTQEQKETAISNIYSYAKEQNKLDYAKKVNEEIKPSTLYTTMKEIEKGGGKQSEYLSYLAKTKGISKENEKNKVLADSNYSNKTKEIIYANGTGKDDNLYNNLLSKSNINMTEYLKYKNKLSEKAFGADKDKNGKTIAGSAKAKTINYLNNNITGAGNRLLIAGKSYALQNSEKQKLVEYINSSVSTREERLEIYKQLDKNFTIKNGKVYMKVSKK